MNSSQRASSSGLAPVGRDHQEVIPAASARSAIASRRDREIACSYSLAGAHGSRPPPAAAGPGPPCSGATCSAYHSGSPAR